MPSRVRKSEPESHEMTENTSVIEKMYARSSKHMAYAVCRSSTTKRRVCGLALSTNEQLKVVS